jgi:hypothetical protein
MDNITDISKVHAAIFFKVEVCRVGEFLIVDGDSGPIEKVEPEIVVNEKTISDLCP